MEKLKNVRIYEDIMTDLRRMPEESSKIKANIRNYDIDGIDAFMAFFEAICEDDMLTNLKEDITNTFIQVYSLDFQNSYDGIDTFYDGLYGNKKDDIMRACDWLTKNDFNELADTIKLGYVDEKKTSKWINDNTKEIYKAYRYIMFAFEKEFLL